MPRLMSLGVVLVVFIGVAALDTSRSATAQEDVDKPAEAKGESVFTDATPTLLASGVVPAYPALPAALALQQVVIAARRPHHHPGR